MPDALDTRAALRELVFHLIGNVDSPRDLKDVLRRRDKLCDIHAGLCVDAAAPPPPARTVTRAQYDRALRVMRDWIGISDERRMLRIIAALDLRVADDTTEAQS